MRDIILRNLFRLLRSGLFDTTEAIEPMSAWKWRQTLRLAVAHGVEAMAFSGVRKCGEQFTLQLPEDVYNLWQQRSEEYVSAEYHLDDAVSEYSHQEHRLTNKLLDHRLQKIIRQSSGEDNSSPDEPSAEDNNCIDEPSADTLTFLLLLVELSHQMLSNVVTLRLLTDLALLLRLRGDRIDYVTLQNWTARLRMQRVAGIAALLLKEVFHFADDELPFVDHMPDYDIRSLIHEMPLLGNSIMADWHFQQGSDIFVHSTNSTAMMWHVRQSLRHFRLFPSEGLTNLFSSFAHSLSHIEE